MVKEVLAVGFGGMIGSVLRYVLSQLISRYAVGSVYPYGTFIVNLLGCFGVGCFFVLLQKIDLSSDVLKLLLITGLFGGFTTFSAFGIETVTLIKNGNFTVALIYVFSSILLGTFFTYLGIRLCS